MEQILPSQADDKITSGIHSKLMRSPLPVRVNRIDSLQNASRVLRILNNYCGE